MQQPNTRIIVSVSNQKLDVYTGDALVASYPVSTSKFGLGSEEGSNRTPLGSLQISEKLGGEHPEGTIFKSRIPSGIWDGCTQIDDDLVLTRILWLQGLQPDNANTHDRYIYIHGTNQEHLIGQTASYGCVRMRNSDIVELFELVEALTPVNIQQ